MGGSVAFVVRDPSGIVHNHVSWTNCFSGFINDLRVVNKDMGYVQDYLSAHCKDYEKQYRERPGLHPTSYGLIVLDMVADKILHCQGYTSDIGFISNFDVFGKQRFGNTDRPLRKKADGFFKAGRVLHARGRDKEGEDHTFEVASVADMDKLCDEHDPYNKQLTDAGKPVYHCLGIQLDLSPFTVVRFEESKQGFLEFRDTVEKLGFVLTEKDQKGWKKFLKGYDE